MKRAPDGEIPKTLKIVLVVVSSDVQHSEVIEKENGFVDPVSSIILLLECHVWCLRHYT